MRILGYSHALLGIVCLLGTGAAAIADVTNAASNLTLTVQPGGPRTTTSGTNFLNVEGSNNGTFASWGLVGFQASSFGLTGNVSVSSLTISFTESNAAFSAPGDLIFFLTTDRTEGYNNTTLPPILTYNSSAGEAGYDPANASFSGMQGYGFQLGTGAFTHLGSGGNGTVDSYRFDLSALADAQAWLNAAITTEGEFHLVVGSASPGLAATWAGATSTSFSGPTMDLTYTQVPESGPGLAALAAGSLVLVSYRRRRDAGA